MKFARIGAAIGLWAASAAGIMAETGAVHYGTVVELYTSQGCSSCPPADAFLRDLSQQPGVIALSLHVDYWDYIGWTDSFGNPRFTERQKAYARAVGERTIYTPQMIVGGQTRVEGVDPGAVGAAIRQVSQAAVPVDLTATRKGEVIEITAHSTGAIPGPMRLQLVRFVPSEEVMIDRGENAGRVVEYTNVVTSWQVIETWDGSGVLQVSAQVPGPQGIVVILQSEGPGAITTALRLD